jgi:phosphatidate cytidylyltransferase
LTKSGKGVITAFSVVCVPACAISETLWGCGVYAIAICFFVLALALLGLLIFKNEETTMENIGSAFVCAVYPTLLLCLLMLTNHLGENSTLALSFIFVVSPLSDVAAFFTGMSLRKKFPKKLAPTISPNKTVVGFIGGLFGGMLAGAAIYFVYNAICGSFANMYIQLPTYIALGLLCSIVSCFGDLVESAIKRQRGIKDMGNIMPGHGGVLDRIDSTMFTAIVVYAAFVLAGALVV